MFCGTVHSVEFSAHHYDMHCGRSLHVRLQRSFSFVLCMPLRERMERRKSLNKFFFYFSRLLQLCTLLTWYMHLEYLNCLLLIFFGCIVLCVLCFFCFSFYSQFLCSWLKIMCSVSLLFFQFLFFSHSFFFFIFFIIIRIVICWLFSRVHFIFYLLSLAHFAGFFFLLLPFIACNIAMLLLSKKSLENETNGLTCIRKQYVCVYFVFFLLFFFVRR